MKKLVIAILITIVFYHVAIAGTNTITISSENITNISNKTFQYPIIKQTENVTNISNNNIIVIEPGEHDNFLLRRGSLLESWQYPEGTCELAAKTYQKEYGGNLVFIAPTKNGAWIEGKYAGAWINQITHNGTILYIDYINQKIYTDKESLTNSMRNIIQNKHNYENIDVRIFVYGVDTIPFRIIWNY